MYVSVHLYSKRDLLHAHRYTRPEAGMPRLRPAHEENFQVTFTVTLTHWQCSRDSNDDVGCSGSSYQDFSFLRSRFFVLASLSNSVAKVAIQ